MPKYCERNIVNERRETTNFSVAGIKKERVRIYSQKWDGRVRNPRFENSRDRT
jgi:hypothetical protein